MNRRSFLKGVAGVSLAGLATLLAPGFSGMRPASVAAARLESKILKRTLQGTDDGLILESDNGGLSWHRVANFGRHCSVEALLEEQGRIYAHLSVQGNGFLLSSKDARTWYTAALLPTAG
jgi:hypothetical protein